VESALLDRALSQGENLLEGLASDLDSGRFRADVLEKELAGLQELIRSVEAELVKGESRIELLGNMVERREGMTDGAKAVMNEAARDDGRLAFVKGILGEMIDVDVRNSKAVEAVLGDLTDAVVVSDLPQAGKVMEFLYENDLDGVTVLALSEFGSGRGQEDSPFPQPADSPFLADRVLFRADLKPLVDDLLHGILLLEDEEDRRVPGDGGESWVNIRGDYYRKGVLRIGGAPREPGVIARRSEWTALRKRMDGVRGRLEALRERQGVFERSLASVRAGNERLSQQVDDQEFEIAAQSAEHGKILDRMGRLFRELKVLLEEGFDIEKSIVSLNGEMKDLQGEGDEIRGQVARRSKALDVANIEVDGHRSETVRLEKLLKDLEIRIVEHRGRRESLERERAYLRKNLEESQNRLEELVRDRERLETLSEDVLREIARLKTRTEEMASERAGLSSEMETVGRHLDSLKSDFEEKNGAVGLVEEQLEKYREKLDGIRMEIREVEVKQQNLRERARDEIDVDLDLTAAGGSGGDLAADLEAVEREIQELRGRIARIGNVNLEAVTELESIEERFKHLV
jgi:chromosome segregation protein